MRPPPMAWMTSLRNFTFWAFRWAKGGVEVEDAPGGVAEAGLVAVAVVARGFVAWHDFDHHALIDASRGGVIDGRADEVDLLGLRRIGSGLDVDHKAQHFSVIPVLTHHGMVGCR